MAMTENDDTGGVPRILCVDDEALVGEVVSRILATRLDCCVEYVASGRQVLRRLAEVRAQALVIDYVMPGMNGGELYRRVARRWPELAGRCLFITGDTVNPGTLEAIQETGQPYLVKPFELEDLTDAVRDLLAAPQSSPS